MPPDHSREAPPALRKFTGFIHALGWVPRETAESFGCYYNLLSLWNKRINLISSCVADEEIWHRHFLDSAQLALHLPSPENAGTITDLGSGGGFPGMVLALLGYRVTLVERDQRKATFLNEVARQTGANAIIAPCPVEALYNMSPPHQPDYITSRAFAALPKLFSLIMPLLHEKLNILLLKGKTANIEIEDARKEWDFTFRNHASITDPEASVLHVTELRKKMNKGM